MTDTLCCGPFGSGARLAANARLVESGVIRLLRRITGLPLPPLDAASPIEQRVLVAGTAAEALRLLDGPVDVDALRRLVTETLDALVGPPSSRAVVGPFAHQLLEPSRVAPAPLALILARARANLESSGAATAFALSDAGPATAGRLTEALLLLRRVVPALAGSALPHVAGIALLQDCDVESAFLAPTPDVVYINPYAHRTPAGLADALLHEALHQKLAHIRLTRRLYRPGYDDFRAPVVPIPWGDRRFRTFSIGRALAAAHVYVHLTAFHLALLATGDHGGLSADAVHHRLLVRAGRAGYLVEALATPRYQAELGADGPPFLAWLTAALRHLDATTVGAVPLASLAQDPAA